MNNPFILDEKYTFEIGGKDVKQDFVVADDIEIGANNKIPLCLFGFLYYRQNNIVNAYKQIQSFK